MRSHFWRRVWYALTLVAMILWVVAYNSGPLGKAVRSNTPGEVCQPAPPRQLSPSSTPQPPVKPSPTSVASNFLTCPFTDGHGVTLPYYLAVPKHLSPFGRYPLVLLLHGGGERGSTSNTPAQNRGVLLSQPYVQDWESPAVQNHWPSFIVVPQLMGARRWVDVSPAQGSYHLALQPTDSLRMAKEIVDGLQQAYPQIDPTRLYVTGISIGGYGVWDAIERWPEYFAAAAPLSGGGDPAGAKKLTHLPIWAFHGGADGEPPPTASQAMIQAIRAAGGHPHLTIFPQAGHEIWVQVYSSQDFLSWFFAQRNALWGGAQP
jgi:predicted peptidase